MDQRHSPPVGRDAVATLVRQALNLSSDREANNLVNVVTDSIVAVLTANIELDGFGLSKAGIPIEVKTGDVVLLPAEKPHAVKATTRFKMVLTMIWS